MTPIKELNTETIRNNPEAARVYIEELKESKQELLAVVEALLDHFCKSTPTELTSGQAITLNEVAKAVKKACYL